MGTLFDRYIRFIELYGLKEKPEFGYYERHHITPKHLGGGNSESNLVYLSAKQHCYAHYLLWKIFDDWRDKTAYSMLKFRLGQPDLSENNPMYDPEIAAKISGENHYMKKLEYRQYFSEMRKGVNNPMFGKNNPKRWRKVITPFGEFNSMTEAAKSLQLNCSTIRNRIKRKEEGWYYPDQLNELIQQ